MWLMSSDYVNNTSRSLDILNTLTNCFLLLLASGYMNRTSCSLDVLIII